MAVLAARRYRYGDQAVTAAQVVAQAAADRGNRITARRLGYALRRWHGRIGDGMRLQRAGAHNAAMVAVFAAWYQVYGEEPVTAAQVAADAQRAVSQVGGGLEPEYPALQEALSQACADRRSGGKITARALGYALRRWRDRIADGLRLENVGATGKSKVISWRITSVDGG